MSDPPYPFVGTSKADRFADMRHTDFNRSVQIRDRPCRADDPMVCPRAESQTAECILQKLLRCLFQNTIFLNLACFQFAVEMNRFLPVTRRLNFGRRRRLLPHFGRGFRTFLTVQVLVGERLHLHTEIHAVEKRLADARKIAADISWCAGTTRQIGIKTTGTGVQPYQQFR